MPTEQVGGGQLTEAKEVSFIYQDDGVRKITINGSTYTLPRSLRIEAAYLPRKSLHVNSGESVVEDNIELGVFTTLKMWSGSNPPQGI
jgi:hypothetical protein